MNAALRLALLLALTTALPAQDAAVRGARTTGPLLARAADTDGDGVVSVDEWQRFLAALPVGADGALDRSVLKARLLLPYFDADGSLGLSTVEVEAVLKVLDRNGDGALAAGEMGGRSMRRPPGQPGGQGQRGQGQRDPGQGDAGRGGGARRGNTLVLGIVADAADDDRDGAVSSEEWRGFLAALPESVEPAVVATWVHRAQQNVPAERSAFTAATYLVTLDSNLDADSDGRVTAADLRATFVALDRNGDGSLQADERRPPRAAGAGAGRGGRGGGWGIPTAEDRARPPLMPWQRTLEDALAMVAKTGKPLLICVNIDGEPASAGAAFIRYRRPEFVAWAEGFIPVVASPDRHSLADYDDRGRRVVDPKFGRVIDREHIDIEPLLYERYFGGQRTAPRHIGIAPDGAVLFDLSMIQDHRLIDEALQQHGNHEVAIRSADALTESELLKSPDAGHRDRLEQMFLAGDEATRLRLTEAAISQVRRVQHPQILRMALRDGAPAVQRLGACMVAAHAERVPLDLLSPAFRAAHGRPGVTAALVDAMYGLAEGAADEGVPARARWLQQVFTGLQVASTLVDAARWHAAEALSSGGGWPAADPEQLSQLDALLSGLERKRRSVPDDAGIDLQIARATMHYAQIRLVQGKDPTFLLEDVRTAARRARRAPEFEARATGYLAWASWLLNEPDAAVVHAALAMPGLVDGAGGLAAEVLDVLALGRTRQIYAALGENRDLPASWIADACAAYEALLLDTARERGQATALAYIDLLGALEAWGRQHAVIGRALQRWPAVPRLHELLRSSVLRDRGAAGLEQFYASMPRPAEHAAAIDWFAGLASLFAAERQVQCDAGSAALDSYRRSVSLFRTSIAANADFRGSALHYVGLALAGAARVHVSLQQWSAAQRLIQEALVASPASFLASDGLGHTPRDTAAVLYRALRGAERAEDAEQLRQRLERAGVSLAQGS